MYAQEIKQGTLFIMNGITYTTESVTYVHGYHGRYVVVATVAGRRTRFTFYAGEQVDTP